MAAVEVNGLGVRYGPVLAVDRVDFTAEAGSVVALLGPNGAGKTSTVRALAGSLRPSSGQVRVLGADPAADRAGLARRVGVMPQDGGVHPGIRAAEAVALYAAFYPEPLDPGDLLERVGLTGQARRTWRQLSGGEQQRLSLALALVGRPRVALLDEPTAGVDVAGRRRVREVIAALRADGVCVVVTTHELAEAEVLADRVVIVDRGRVVADGTLAELRASAEPADIRFAAAPGLDVAALGAAVGGSAREVAPGAYVVDHPPDPAAVARLTNWLAAEGATLGELRAGNQSLEDLFVRLTAPDDADATPPAGRGARRRRRPGRQAS